MGLSHYSENNKLYYNCLGPGVAVPAAPREGRRPEGVAAEDNAGLLLRAEPAAEEAVRGLLAGARAA